MQKVKIPAPIGHFGYNFKCKSCNAEYHVTKFGELGKHLLELGKPLFFKCDCDNEIEVTLLEA